VAQVKDREEEVRIVEGYSVAMWRYREIARFLKINLKTLCRPWLAPEKSLPWEWAKCGDSASRTYMSG
jgi:hypothetical protein